MFCALHTCACIISFMITSKNQLHTSILHLHWEPTNVCIVQKFSLCFFFSVESSTMVSHREFWILEIFIVKKRILTTLQDFLVDFQQPNLTIISYFWFNLWINIYCFLKLLLPEFNMITVYQRYFDWLDIPCFLFFYETRETVQRREYLMIRC